MAAIQSLCGRAISLISGEVCDDGPTEKVIQSYLERFNSKAMSGFHDNTTRRTSSSATLAEGRILDQKGNPTITLCAGEPTVFELDYINAAFSTTATFIVTIRNQHNIPVTQLRTVPPIPLAQRGTVRLTLKDTPLPIGKYTVDLKIKATEDNEDLIPNALQFDVIMVKGYPNLEKISSRLSSVLTRQDVEHITEQARSPSTVDTE